MRNTLQLVQLINQLTETLMIAAVCADEIRAIILADITCFHTKEDVDKIGSNGVPIIHRPLLDESTFSVRWHGKSLHLGNTRLFWVLDHLAGHLNKYVPHLELIQEVWDDEELTTATIRSVIRQLRNRLRSGGMDDLADAIRGHNGHYVLALEG